MEDTSVSCEARLASLKSNLEKIHQSWTKNLLKDLDDPVIQNNFELLKAPQKKLLKDFMAAKELPDEITTEFLSAIQQATFWIGQTERANRRPEKGIVPRWQPGYADRIQGTVQRPFGLNSKRPRRRQGAAGN
jgi:hypothetical protein